MHIQSNPFNFHPAKTVQALRYHFIQRREIKVLLIMVNVFAIMSAGLYYGQKISPFAFLISSLLWFVMMLSFWFFMPRMIYKRTATFKDAFEIKLDDDSFTLIHARAQKSWPWTAFSGWMETPHFFHLYFDEKSFFMFPKEAFKDDDVHAARSHFKKTMKSLR
jgi:hypothetical protein